MKPHSGKFIVRIAPSEHGRLKAESLKRGLSLNELCQEKLITSGATTDTLVPGSGSLKASDLVVLADQLSIPLLAIVLFGSFSRGDETAASDVDLLLVVAKSQAIDRALYLRWDAAYQALKMTGTHELSVHFAQLPDPASSGSLWLECALEGILIYEKRGTGVKKMLCEIRKLIAEGRWRRQYAYGQPYWVGMKQ